MKVLSVLSSRTTRWKSARLHGGVMLQPLSAPLPSGVRFFQHPLPAIPSAFLADAPAPKPGRNVGFTMLVSSDTNELIPAFHTGSLECPRVPSLRWNNRLPCRFWPEPVSVFGSLSMTVPTAVHFCWTYHSACPSDHIDARSRGDCLAEISSSPRWRDVVSAASDPTVTSRAGANRLLRTEPQVRLTNLFSYRTITGTSSLFHTHALPLTFVRFSRPRSSRGVHAECPRNGSAAARFAVRRIVLDSVVAVTHPRPWQSGKQSITVAFPMECPCPQSVHIQRQGASAIDPQTGNVRALSAACARTGIVRELVGDAASPRPINGREHVTFCPQSRPQHDPETSAYVLV